MTTEATDYDRIAHLVTRSLKGDAEAFETLVRMHLRTAVTVALGVTGRVADAEDVAQDAFILAHRKLKSCRDPRRFSGWLLQIVRNQALNCLKKRRRQESRSGKDDMSDISQSSESATINKQLIMAALNQLEMTQREIVLLHTLEGWSHDEIADHLKMTSESSRWQLFQARREMKTFVERSSSQRKKVIYE